MADDMLGSRALIAADDNGADDAAEKVARGVDLAAAWQGLAIGFAHILGSNGPTEIMTLPHPADPTVLWRLTRGRSTAHATIFPGASHTTLTWYFDGVMDRAEKYDSDDLALARADEIRGVLLRDGWKAPD